MTESNDIAGNIVDPFRQFEHTRDVVIQISKEGVEDSSFREFLRHHYAEKLSADKVVFDVIDV